MRPLLPYFCIQRLTEKKNETMKRTATLIAAALLSFPMYGQATYYLYQDQERPYAQNGCDLSMGFNVSQLGSGSGHGSSYVMNTSLQKGRRTLQIGAMYEEEQGRISGADVKFKYFLGQNGSIDNQKKKNNGVYVLPYIHYNCIYHSSVVNTPVVLNRKKSAPVEVPGDEGMIATMEHFTGIGIQLKLANALTLDGSIGIGTYIGSLDKLRDPGTFGIHQENHGFVLAFEFGLGYNFNL